MICKILWKHIGKSNLLCYKQAERAYRRATLKDEKEVTRQRWMENCHRELKEKDTRVWRWAMCLGDKCSWSQQGIFVQIVKTLACWGISLQFLTSKTNLFMLVSLIIIGFFSLKTIYFQDSSNFIYYLKFDPLK